MKEPKVKHTISLDRDLYEWVMKKVKTKDFASLSHAVEKGLYLLKEKREES